MSIEITARHKDISTGLQDYARGKAEEICSEYPKTTSVKVVLDFDRHIYKSHFTATVDGIQFDADAEDSDNIKKTIEEAGDKVFRQIRKQFDKLGDNRK